MSGPYNISLKDIKTIANIIDLHLANISKYLAEHRFSEDAKTALVGSI